MYNKMYLFFIALTFVGTAIINSIDEKQRKTSLDLTKYSKRNTPTHKFTHFKSITVISSL